MGTTTLAERVRYLCDASSISRERLSKICGLTPSHLGLIIAGRNVTVTSATASRICRATSARLDWLIDAVGEAPLPADVRAAVEAAEHETEGAA